MPYKETKDLPAPLQKHLPKHAQKIYLEAFNNAWRQYHAEEATAHKVAWQAVKQGYHKSKTGKWVRH